MFLVLRNRKSGECDVYNLRNVVSLSDLTAYDNFVKKDRKYIVVDTTDGQTYKYDVCEWEIKIVSDISKALLYLKNLREGGKNGCSEKD